MGSSEQKNVLLAVVLSGLVLFTWQVYFAPKQDITQVQKSVATESSEAKAIENKTKAVSTPKPEVIASQVTSEVAADKPLQVLTLKNSGFELQLNSDLTPINFQSPDVKLSFAETVGKEKSLNVQILTDAGYKSLNFDFVQSSENVITGTNSLTGARMVVTLEEDGSADFALNSNRELNYRFAFNSAAKELENRKYREYALYHNSSLNHFNVGDEESGEGKLDWAAIDFNYHLFALTFPEKVVGKFAAKENAVLNLDLVNPVKTLNYSLVFAKKNYDTLSQYKSKLEHSVDFGMFSVLAVPILRGLQFFYKYIPNYGIAIILLTLIIRMLTFPLQFKSFKSMKKMQKIQPDLQKLKEKYKDDPQRMQRETMELFKRAGANPLGGCLPLVLQMPIFFAFYQVLYNAYELVQAPFVGWIADLSIKDPYYVLPVLMGGAMFLQTKLNPSASADPTQKRLMLFMPLVFTFIMKDLPAGLNLYIFVSTLFGIAQQLLVYRMVD